MKDPATVSMMEVERVEIREAREPFEIVNEQSAALVIDHSRFTELLESAVHVDAGEAESIGQHFLRKRHFAAVAVDEPG